MRSRRGTPRTTRVVAGHELRALWATPVPWIVGALLHVVLGVLVVAQLQAREQAVFQPVVPIAGFLLLLAVPVLTMRTLADEARTGTLDLLLTTPLRARSLVIGKWAALWFTALVLLAPVVVTAALLRWWGEPDGGPVATGLLGLALLAAAVAAVGVLTSSATSSQPVAAMASLFALLVVWFAHVGSETTATGPLLASFSVSERLRTFAGGGIDSGDVAFFWAVVGVALAAATVLVAIRRVDGTRRVVVAAAVVALAAVGAAVAADRNRGLADLTAEGTLTLTPETRDVVARLRRQPGRVRITAFVPRDDPFRVSASALLSRYRRLDHRISFRVLDPDSSPGEARRLRVAVPGGVAVVRGDRVEHAAAPVEPDVTAALARIVRGTSPIACTARGHGEADVEDTLEGGASGFAALLRDNGYRVRPIDLLASPVVPGACDAVVLASPRTALGAGGDALARYLDGGGRALVLADPASDVDLGPLLGPWGLGIRRGIVLEGDAEARRPDDPTAPILRRFSSGSPVVRNLPPVFVPGAQEVVVDDDPATPGLTTSRLADTSPTSYLETEPLRPDFDPARDRPGPITVAATADRSALRGGRVDRTRLVVLGDVDLATNAFLGDAANATLLVQAMDWLTLDEELVTVSPNLPSDRPLALTSARLAYARALTAGVVPGLFLLAGAAVWAARRRR